MHVKLLIPSLHVPPFTHGDNMQSLIFVTQVTPLKPGAHEHVKLLIPSLHVPPFTHGDNMQSLIFVRQVTPL